MTSQGSEVITSAILESRASLAAEARYVDRVLRYASPGDICMIDYPFTADHVDMDWYIGVVRRVRPRLAVAPDVEGDCTLDDAIRIGDALLDYADAVVIVSKECKPSMVPRRFRVGISLGKFGSVAQHWLWEYKSCGPVHILGGGTSAQMRVRDYVEVASLDTATLIQRAYFGTWDNGAINAPSWMDFKDRFIFAVDNYVKWWSHDN